MKKRIFFFLALVSVISLTVGFRGLRDYIFADDLDTSVDVGNSAPSFDVNPQEKYDSDELDPTDVGDDVTFEATGTDENDDDYYLAVCQTDAVTATNGGVPTCDAGTWCVSGATATDVEASCSYTALQGDAETNEWYAFVCDGDSDDAKCSSSDQGTGAPTGAESPFHVNHPPVFNAISNDSPLDPGEDVTWSTDVSTTDPDTGDTVRLFVCKTSDGVEPNSPECVGGSSNRWCMSAGVSDNPSCSYTVPIPTDDQSYDAWVYLADQHFLEATGVNEGSESDFTVNNVAPVNSDISINSGSDITLSNPQSTTNVTVQATVTDNNGCEDVVSSTFGLYRSSYTFAACDGTGGNANYCYPDQEGSAGATCTGSTDADAVYSATVPLQYHADPTVADTEYPSDTWLVTVESTDEAIEDEDEIGTGVEMNTFLSYSVSSSINYGSLSVGDTIDPLTITTTTTATGNVGLDQDQSGDDMCTDYPACSEGVIAVGYQKYALSSSTAYADGTALTDSATEVELNCPKTTVTASPETKLVYWGISVPSGTPSGSYSGVDTLVAAVGESGNW